MIVSGASNVVLVDNSLANSGLLIGAAVKGDKIFTYDGARDSPGQLLDEVYLWAKAQGLSIGSLSILAHGQPGAFRLGDAWISPTTLAMTAPSWKQFDQVLAPSAVIDLYGCNVAAPAGQGVNEGQTLIDRIARLTGASVFASTNLTGRGGDWILEAESATHVATASPDISHVFSLSALAAYPDTLSYTLSVATAAAVSSSPVTGTTVNLSVLGATTNPAGESSLLYTWSATTAPATPTYSANGTNASKNCTATFTKAGAYVFRCTISDSSGSTAVTSSVSVTVSQTLTTMTLTGSAASINEAQTRTLTAKGYDQFGVIMAPEPTWTWSVISGAGSVASVTATTGKYTPTNVAGTMVVQCGNGSVSKTFSITVVEVSPTVSTAAKATPSPATGTTTVLSVAGASDGGAANLTYTWAATTEPSGANPTFSANGTNAAKSSTVTFNKSGSYTFTATINDGQGGTVTSAVTVAVNQTLTSITLFPSSATLHTTLTQQFTATGYDQFGIAMASQPTFTWTVNGGGAGGTVNSSGLYTAPSSVGSGSDTVKAASGAINGTAAIAVTAASLNATASPSTVTGNTTSLSTLSSLDTGQATLTYTWATTGSPPAAVAFSINNTNGAKNTTATFTKSGSYTIQASVYLSGVLQSSSSTTVTVNQTLTSITVTPSTASLNLNQTQTFSASALDQFGIAMASQPTLTWTMNNGSVGSFNTSTLVYSSGSTPGNATINAKSGSITGSAVVTVTEAPPTVATTATASPSPVTGLTTNLSVLGASSGGESNLTYTWAAMAQPGGSNPTFNDNDSNGAKNATVTFDTAGSYTFTVTITDQSGNTVTSAVAVVVSQTVTTISVSPGTASLGAAGTQSFSATAADQFGNTMSLEPTFTWSVDSGSIDQSGNYTAPLTSATPTVTASAGGISGTASVTVTNAPPTIAIAASATPATVTGTTTALSALGADDGGESNLTYTWATTGTPPAAVSFSANGANAAKNSTATFAAAGTYNFQVTISDSGKLTVTSSVSVTVNQTLTTITVSPGSNSLNENQTQQFSAVAFDQFGTTMVSQPAFTWTKTAGIGSVNSSGVYTSPGSSGTAAVMASSGGVSGTAAVTISNASPTVATAAAAPSPVSGTTTALSVLGADDGGESNLTYTWTTAGSAPASVTFSANGTNASKNATATFTEAGTYNFQVTITDAGGLTVTSSVSVTVNQTLTTILVSPGSTSLNENSTQSFTAVAYDQFGNSMASQPMFTWSKTAGIGSVNSSGVYTSPGSSGTAAVTASSGSISGVASVTINNAAPTVATAATSSLSSGVGFVATDGTSEGSWQGVYGSQGYSIESLTPSLPTGVSMSVSGNQIYTWAASTTDVRALQNPGGGRLATCWYSGGSFIVNVNIANGNAYLLSLYVVDWDSTTRNERIDVLNSAGTTVLATQTVANFNGGKYVQFQISGSVQIKFTSLGGANAVLSGMFFDPAVLNTGSTNLSVLGADDGGESNLTYTWSTSGTPPAAVSFSANGTNAAKNTTATFSEAGTYNFLATIIDAGGLSVTSALTVTVAQTLTTITVTPASTSLNENQTQQFSAISYDQFGTAMASQPTFIWSQASGVGSLNSSGLYTAPYGTGIASITARSGFVSGSASISISNAAPTVATSASASPGSVTGSTTALSVLGADDGGEPNLTYTWATTGTPPAAVMFSANSTNASKNTTATFAAAGTYNLQVTITDAGGLTATSSVSVTVNQTLTSISVSPSTSSLNENQTQQFSAIAYDQFGAAMSSQPSFTWSETTGIGSISGSGLYTAPTSSGSATMTAVTGGVSGTASVTITNASPTVAAAASASPSPVTGSTTALSALGDDDGGESNLTYTWTATAEPSGANPTFSVNGTITAKNSTVTFDEAGNYIFTVTISDGQGGTTNSSVSVTVNQTLTTITVSPPSSSLNENQTQQFSAVAYDQFGAVMASQPVFTWSKASGVGSVDSSGLYTAPYGTGSASVKAANGAVSGTVSVTIANAAPAVATTATASPNPVTGSATALSVLGADDSGESNLTYTWAATAKPGGANPIFSANGTNSSKNSSVTFDEAGDYTFTVTISDGQGGTTNSSVNVTVNQTLTSITVSPGSSTLNENQAQQLSAVGYDQFGIVVASQSTFTWSLLSGVGSISSSGLFTAPFGTGSASVAATSGVVSGTASVTVTNAAPRVATAAAASPSPVSGTTTALSVLGADDGGESNLTYTWAATSEPSGANPFFSANGTNAAQESTVTFDDAGSYTFTVTISDGQGGTTNSSVNVTVDQTLTTITVSPASTSLNENQTQQFTAVGYDQFGDAMSSQPAFTWSRSAGIGSIDSDGVYTSPGSSGTATVKASSGGVSGNASVTVTNASPTVATPASASVSPVAGTTTALSVLGADDGGEGNLTYTWAVTSEPSGANPTFSANGTNAAKSSTVTFNEAGNYTFTATIADAGGLSTTSSVNVTVAQTLTTITVSPASASLNENQTQQLTATGYDQFGNPMATQPAFAWSSLGIGSIDSGTGVYTAPGAVGTATISASSGGVSGTATVTVTDASPTVATAASASPVPVTGTTTLLSVLGADDAGEANLTYIWTAGAEPAGASPVFSDNATNSAKNSAVTFDEAGNYTFTVMISDGQGGSTSSSINVAVDQSLSSIVVTPTSKTLDENGTAAFVATGLDQFGKPMASQPAIVWSVSNPRGNVDASGNYTAPAVPGTYQIIATSGATSGSASIDVVNAAPTIAVQAAATEAVVSGNSVGLSVLGADDGGESNLTYTWTTTSRPSGAPNPGFSVNGTNTAKDTTATFFAAGTYVFRVDVSDGSLTTSSVVTVRVDQTLSQIVVNAAQTAMPIEGSQQLGVASYDQFGAVLVAQPLVAWSVAAGSGTVNATGQFTAPATAETDTISATANGVSGSVSIGVYIGDSAVASPSSVSGTFTNLSVTGDGGRGWTYDWSVVSKPSGAVDPQFSANGSSAARVITATFAASGTYAFDVAVSDGTITTKDSVSVTVTATPTSLIVSPPSVSIHPGETAQLIARAYDQFGIPLLNQPIPAWTLFNGTGTVNSAGSLVAGTSIGETTVVATAGSLRGLATISITRAQGSAAFGSRTLPAPIWLLPTDLDAVLTELLGASTATMSPFNSATYQGLCARVPAYRGQAIYRSDTFASTSTEVVENDLPLSLEGSGVIAAGGVAKMPAPLDDPTQPMSNVGPAENAPALELIQPIAAGQPASRHELTNASDGSAIAEQRAAASASNGQPRQARAKIRQYLARALDGCIAIAAAALAGYLVAAKLAGLHTRLLEGTSKAPPPE